jgi:hypothetical protein
MVLPMCPVGHGVPRATRNSRALLLVPLNLLLINRLNLLLINRGRFVSFVSDRDGGSGRGLWLRESAHGQGFGREVVTALVEWGHATLGKESFIYPVAVQNTASRRIAESLNGLVIGKRTNPKYDSVVYRIPFY